MINKKESDNARYLFPSSFARLIYKEGLVELVAAIFLSSGISNKNAKEKPNPKISFKKSQLACDEVAAPLRVVVRT